jgi:hypothetical protein
LNFIGALSLLEAMDPHSTSHFDRAEEWLRSAMAARADEWLRWFYHLAAEQVFFDSQRILIDPKRPETYFYDYSGN